MVCVFPPDGLPVKLSQAMQLEPSNSEMGGGGGILPKSQKWMNNKSNRTMSESLAKLKPYFTDFRAADRTTPAVIQNLGLTVHFMSCSGTFVIRDLCLKLNYRCEPFLGLVTHWRCGLKNKILEERERETER